MWRHSVVQVTRKIKPFFIKFRLGKHKPSRFPLQSASFRLFVVAVVVCLFVCLFVVVVVVVCCCCFWGCGGGRWEVSSTHTDMFVRAEWALKDSSIPFQFQL